MLLPFVLFAGGTAITDVATTAAVTGGVNDNVIQTTDENGHISRHPQAFSGLEGSFTLRFTEPNTDVHGLRVMARAQGYQSLDGSDNASPDGTAQGVWMSTFTLDRFTTATFSLSSSITSLTSARVGDASLFYTLDPASTQTTFTLSQGSMTITHELSDKWRFRVGGGLLVTSTVAAPPLQLADGLILDRRGIDGVQPFGTASLIRDLSERDTADVSVMYLYTYAPYSLDFTTTPPRAGGPQKLHQAIPDAGLAHKFNEYWLGIGRAGVSVSNTPTFDPDKRAIVYPQAHAELHFADERWQFIGAASYTYGAVVPRVGAGPAVSANATLVGVPYSYGHWTKMVGIFNLVGLYAQQKTTETATTTLTAVGASAQLRYPLGHTLGLLGGYDVRLSTSGTTGTSIVPYFRQIAFIGISGWFTTDPGILPIQVLDAPFKPG